MPGTGRLRLTRATLITALNRDTPFHRTTGVHERRRRSCPTKSSRSATDASELDATQLPHAASVETLMASSAHRFADTNPGHVRPSLPRLIAPP